MRDLGLSFGRRNEVSSGGSIAAGDGFGYYYTGWEADRMRQCDCDRGYFGPDCSESERLGPLS